MSNNITLYGAGGHCKVVVDILQTLGYSIKRIVDDHGKYAKTYYKSLMHKNNQTLVECKLVTGRTHQIRVHMASIRHPLLGDTTYGPKNAMGLTGQCLHARVLGFIHPRTGEYVEFEAPLPEYFQKLLEKYS